MSQPIIILPSFWQKPLRGALLNSNHHLIRGLIASFDFMEGGGSLKVYDSLHQANTGTINGTASWCGGKSGFAIDFDGSSGYIKIPTAAGSILDALQPITIEVLFKADDTTDEMIVQRFEAIGAAKDIQLWISAGTLHWRDSSGDWDATVAVTTGAWCYVVGTYDGTTANLYVNGVLKGTDPTGTISMNSNNEPWLIATDSDAAGGGNLGNWFNGKIEFVRWRNVILTPEEVRQLYTGPYYIYQQPLVFVIGAAGVPAALNLTVQNSIHGNLSDVITNTRLRGDLTVQSSIHNHLSDIISNTRSRGTMNLQNPVHGHLADLLDLARSRTLTAQDTVHGQVADIPALPRSRFATVKSSIHGHIADLPLLSKARLLQLQDAVHGHIADAISPSRVRLLVLQEPIHAQVADSVLLSVGKQLVAQGTIHGQLADILALSKSSSVTLQEPVHGQIASISNLTRSRTALVRNAIHGHLASIIALTGVGTHNLILQDSVHGHIASSISLSRLAGAIYQKQMWTASTMSFNFLASGESYNNTANLEAFTFTAKKDK